MSKEYHQDWTKAMRQYQKSPLPNSHIKVRIGVKGIGCAKLMKNGVTYAAIGLAGLLSLSEADAQSYYQSIGRVTNPVEVDTSVLEKLGEPTTLPDLLRQGPIVIGRSSNVPGASRTSAPTSAVTPTPVAVPTAPQSGLASSAVTPSPTSAPTPVPAAAPKPAPAAAPQSGLASLSNTPEAAAITPQKTAKAPPAPPPNELLEPETPKPAVAAPEPPPAPKPVPQPAAAEAEPAPEPTPEPEAVAETPTPQPIATPQPVATSTSTEASDSASSGTFQPPPDNEATAAAEDQTDTGETESSDTAGQVAALTPAVADPNVISSNPNGFSIKFQSDKQDLPPGAKPELETLAAQMRDNQTMRVKLVGYSAPIGSSASQSRRMSLFRALAVRTYLLKQEISSRRIDVHARGDKLPDEGEANRVDVEVQR